MFVADFFLNKVLPGILEINILLNTHFPALDFKGAFTFLTFTLLKKN